MFSSRYDLGAIMKNSEIQSTRNRYRRAVRDKKPLWKKLITALLIICVICFTGAGAGFLLSVTGTLPDVSQNFRPEISSQIFDCNGKLITTVHAEQNRLPVSIDEIPENLQNGFIAAEDVRFYQHHGIDPRGILRAIYKNIISGNSTGQGGSTITQQLARNAFLSQDQTIKRKLLEAVLAIEIENKYTKKEILEMYINQIYFGQGAYGAQTASHIYFGKDVKDLNLAQCALLAGLPNSPNYYSPFRSLEAAKYRQGLVLDQMAKYGYITPEQAEEAKNADLGLMQPNSNESNNFASYFVSYVIQTISDKYDSDVVYKEGLKIYTTLDLDMQKEAEAAVKQGLPAGDKDANGLTQPQGALITIEAKTGNVKAMVGGRGEDQFNRAVQMYRQPGSAFKPFTYVTALEAGMSPLSMLGNERVTFGGWSPKNYAGTTSAPVTMTEALVHSLNIPTVNLANKVGMSNVLETAKKCGISSLVESGPYNDGNLASALGGLTKGVSLWDMAKAYSVFANNGKLVQPRVILRVEDRNGNVLEDHNETPKEERVLEETAVQRLNAMLEQVVLRGTGGGAYIGTAMAGKTGTTDQEHDAWFVGYTPELVTAVWIGDDTGTDAGYTGGTIPATIWRDFMGQVISRMGSGNFDIPPSIRNEIGRSQAETEKENKDKKDKSKEKDNKKDSSEDKNKKESLADKAKNSAEKVGKTLLDKVAGQSVEE